MREDVFDSLWTDFYIGHSGLAHKLPLDFKGNIMGQLTIGHSGFAHKLCLDLKDNMMGLLTEEVTVMIWDMLSPLVLLNEEQNWWDAVEYFVRGHQQ